MGDTHPAYWKIDVPAGEVAKFATEELPGFGVVFNNKPGTPRETYLAFKSGPNRGHYHGDQLAFHYCADARAAAATTIRATGTCAGPGAHAQPPCLLDRQVPLGQHGRLRAVDRLQNIPRRGHCDRPGRIPTVGKATEKPPEVWHQEYPQLRFEKPLCYRRTVVFMKNAAQDYFVFRDQFSAPQTLRATYCLHVPSEKIERQGPAVDFGNVTLYCAEPAEFEFASFPWQHANGPPESTAGARLSMKAQRGQFITVMYPGKTRPSQ